MILANCFRLGTQGATAILLLTRSATVPWLAALQFCAGAAQAVFSPAAAGIVKELVPDTQLKRANGLMGSTLSLGSLLGPVASAGLIALVGPGLSFGVDAASFAIAAGTLAVLKMDAKLPRKSGTIIQSAIEGWSYFSKCRWLWIATVHVMLLNGFGVAPFLVFGPVIAKKSLGGATAWALIGVCYGIGALLGNFAAARLRARSPMLGAIISSLLLLPLLVVLAIPETLPLIMIAAVPAGMQASYYNVTFLSVTQALVPDDKLSRVYSITSLGALCVAPLAMGVAGPAAEFFGVRGTLVFATTVVGFVSIAVMSMKSVREVRVSQWESRIGWERV
jgi:predicted MFS family arabinose efflux permease